MSHVLSSQPFSLSRVSASAQGFTLLELLVVMVIIGLLAGYVGPRYFAQIGKSEVKTARADRRIRKSAGPVPPGYRPLSDRRTGIDCADGEARERAEVGGALPQKRQCPTTPGATRSAPCCWWSSAW